MVEVINELPFPVSTEKQEWLDTATQWRLPYWDWGLPSTAGHIPGLFTLPSISIRQPLNKAGTKPTTLSVTNPLARYQLQTGPQKVPTAMGALPPPYTVGDVEIKNKQGQVTLTFPVSSICRCIFELIFFSGHNARVPAAGASKMGWTKASGCLVLTIGRLATTPLMATSMRTRGLQSIGRLFPICVIESWPQDTRRIGRLLPRLDATESHWRQWTGSSTSHLSTSTTTYM